MRWKLLRRRLSVSAPRVIVRSHLPWPLRWAVLALMLGFSAALALWAFEFGKDIAGLDRVSKQQVRALSEELAQVREQYAAARAVANSAETLIKTEHAAQERLAEQLKVLEQRNAELAGDLGFFEKLLPSTGEKGLSVRGLQAGVESPGQLRYQLLVMRSDSGKSVPARVHCELVITGTLNGRPWSQAAQEGAPRPLEGRPYQRLDGLLTFPAAVHVRQLTARVLDESGAELVSETARL